MLRKPLCPWAHRVVGVVVALAAGSLMAQDTRSRDPRPFAAGEPRAVSASVREARDRLFLSTSEGLPPLSADPPGAPPRVTKVSKVPLAELPIAESDVILVGRIESLSPHLVPGGTAIYTEYHVDVDSIVKNAARWKGPVCDVVEIGGSGLTPDGRALRQTAMGFGKQIEAGAEYVMFLRYVDRAECFRIVKLWQVRNGVLVATADDDIGRAAGGTSTINGMAVKEALKTIQVRIGRQ
ncbi:hypothetical protein [uncultured Paludibaculum sp.]|uniref:hypothetical protein n=1 Tax=uncultured Paludibaculum sp. TaxID=1765020 RepID=UPI002AAB698B|nr:hypothetical protein [uncultured Paludibaculum sp.]